VFDYDDMVRRDKASLDAFWLRDESLGDGENPPDAGVIAAEIVEDLRAALEQFELVALDLGGIDEATAGVTEQVSLSH
jgi:type I restriction enzyme M protein